MVNRFLAFPALLISGTLFFASCQGNAADGENTTTTDSTATASSGGPTISLSPVENSKEFPDAQLGIANVTATPSGDSVRLSFSFNVKNYELKSQTDDKNSELCNNSAQGQHIHFILDNRPYVALYEPKHETTVAKNT